MLRAVAGRSRSRPKTGSSAAPAFLTNIDADRLRARFVLASKIGLHQPLERLALRNLRRKRTTFATFGDYRASRLGLPVKLTVCSSSPVVQIRPALKESVARERYLVAIRLNERKTRASMSELNCVLPTSESLRSLSIVLQHRTFSIPGASARTRIVVRAPQRRTARRDDRRSCVLASFTLWGGVISDPVIAAANITAITGRRTGRRDARSPSKTRAAARARHPILAGRRTSLPRCRRRPADGRPFARKRATRRFGST